MTDFRRVNDRLSVSPQISPAEVAQAKAQGFTTIVNNRPDGEAPDQPPAAEIEAAAKAAGLAYHHIPVTGGPTPDQVEQTRELLSTAETPILAFCRSGTRSIVTWSLAQATSGAQSPSDLVALGRNAGYDLSGVLGG